MFSAPRENAPQAFVLEILVELEELQLDQVVPGAGDGEGGAGLRQSRLGQQHSAIDPELGQGRPAMRADDEGVENVL